MSAIHHAVEASPPDVTTMRDLARRLLEPDAAPGVLPPTVDELEGLILQLRGHLSLLAPDIEELALAQPQDSVPRYCALACVGEARAKLRTTPLPGLNGAAAYARRLARTLDSLCEHHTRLRDAEICPACDKPIPDGDPSVLSDYPSPSGTAARSIRVHAGCANTVRLR